MDKEQKCFSKYLAEGGTIHFHGNVQPCQEWMDFLSQSQILFRNTPDFLALGEKKAVIIEHFEFDCYPANRKGSQNQREQARIDRKRKSLPVTKEGLIYEDIIHGESSYEDYVNNLTRNFNSHYKKIESYKQNLLNDGLIDSETEIKVAFLIEDASPLPCSYIDHSQGRPKMALIDLAHSPEFIELFEKSPNVDFVVSCSTTGEENWIWFIDRTEIFAYKKETIDYKNEEFISWKPCVVGAAYSFTDEELQELMRKKEKMVQKHDDEERRNLG